MGALDSIGSLSDLALLIGLSTTRIAVAFVLLPVFAPETVPALVRNAIFLAFGVVTLVVQPATNPGLWTATQWLTLFGKEALLGIAFGVLLGAVLWAFETAGQIVDTKVGATLAQVIDPLSGHQTSLSGELLGRLAMFIFMAGGGFLLFVGVLVESFSIWPVAQPSLAFTRQGLAVFEAAFAHFALLSLLIAAPALIVLYTIDLGLGLINRYAPQLNLIAISMSLKSIGATAVWLLLFALIVQAMSDQILQAVQALLPQLRALLRT